MAKNPNKRDFIFETYHPCNPIVILVNGGKRAYRYLCFGDEPLIKEKDNKFYPGKITSSSSMGKRWQYYVKTPKSHSWRSINDFKKFY